MEVDRLLADLALRKSIPDSSVPARMHQNENLFVDATGLLQLVGFPPSGIPRVQEFLVRQAIEDSDPKVRPVVFDKVTKRFRGLSSAEELLLTSKAFAWPGGKRNRSVLFGAAFRLARNNPHLRKEFDRLAAERTVGRKRRGPSYILAKTIIRIYRISWKIRRFRRSKNAPATTEIPQEGGIFLFADPTGLGSSFSEVMSASRHRAFICHDLIPLVSHGFVGRPKHAKDFVEKLAFLVKEGAQALCVSEYTMKSLSKFIEDTSSPAIPVGKIPMPSMLYEQAASLGRTSRLESKEPFILYCSTIEIRKNHILLARIWRRAIESGVKLPKLVCVGKWGLRVEKLRAYLAANPELSGHVDFVGQVDDDELINLYRSALFGVMPSYDEGWGLCASECLDFGIPVLVSSAGALQEAVRGLMPVLDPDDEDGWYTQIQQLADNRSLHRRLSDLIKTRYRPVKRQESWQAIKSVLQALECPH